MDAHSPSDLPQRHRVRRLRWQARAAVPADAFALRTLLHEHGEACLAALDRAFDTMAPRDEVWHLPRLALTIRLADVPGVQAAGLAEQVEVAMRAALAQAAAPPRRTADPDLEAGDGGASAAPSSSLPPAALGWCQSVVAEGVQALQHYLATGLLPWTLAGLAAEPARQALSAAALQAAQSSPSADAALDALLPSARGAERIGALLRWLPLLPAALRRRWIAAQPAPVALPAAVAEAWRRWIDADAAERIEWQALWLAGPLDAAMLQAHPALRPGTASGEQPFVPALRSALTAALQSAANPRALVRSVASDASRDTPRADLSDILPAITAALLPAPESPITPDVAQPLAPDIAPASDSWLVPLAGLVLLHPWLARLLDGCGVLDDSGRQIAAAQLPRACALLHALACDDADPAEHELPFIKLLLGLEPDAPLSVALPRLTPADHEEIAALLAAVRDHWSALRGSGNDGLRLSYLQRRGLLARGDGVWQLRMQGESFDLLLGLLPWSIGLVRLPWMRKPLVVEWPTP